MKDVHGTQGRCYVSRVLGSQESWPNSVLKAFYARQRKAES